jgi:glucose-1-phosphate thymidylyltransferase
VNNIVGILPAAGKGLRLKPYNGPKELLSVGYHSVQIGMEIKTMPMVVSQYMMNSLSRAGINRLYFVLSPSKWEIAKFFASGAAFGVNCSYLCQETPNGMPGALDVAYSWVKDQLVCMGMPDTIVMPADCFTHLLEAHTRKRADVTLGIFPTDMPQLLAPVHIDPRSGRVLEIFDKPHNPSYFNTWGIAIWTPSFTELLHAYVQDSSKEIKQEMVLSDVFSEAVKQNLSVYGEVFSSGQFFDIGTPEGLQRTRLLLEYPQLQRER